MTATDGYDRAASVLHRWRRATKLERGGVHFLSRSADSWTIALALCVLVQLPFDLALWWSRVEPSFLPGALSRLPGVFWLACLGAPLPLRGLLNLQLAHRLDGWRRWTPLQWLLVLPICCLPLVGFLSLGTWFPRRRWAEAATRPRVLRLSRGSLRWRRLDPSWHLPPGPLSAVGMFVFDMAVLLLFAAWWGQRGAGITVLVVAGLCCRLGAVVSYVCSQWIHGRRSPPRRLLLVGGGLLAVAPSPFNLLVLLVAFSDGKVLGLVWSRGRAGSSLRRSPVWVGGGERAVYRVWERAPFWKRPFLPRGGGRAAVTASPRARARLASLTRLALFCVFWESYLVGRLLASLHHHPTRSALAAALADGLIGAGGVAALCAAAVLASAGLRKLAAALRLIPAHESTPTAWTATLAAGALAFGVLLGLEPWLSEPELAARFAFTVAKLGAVSAGLVLVLRQPSHRGTVSALLTWCAFWTLVPTLCGVGLLLEAFTTVDRVLVGLGLAAPLLAAVVGLRHLRWLLLPYEPRHICTLPESWERRLLRVLAATALLPLGGLAAPLWVHARLRLLPDRRLVVRSPRLRAWSEGPGGAREGL